jgi:uridylate kinase
VFFYPVLDIYSGIRYYQRMQNGQAETDRTHGKTGSAATGIESADSAPTGGASPLGESTDTVVVSLGGSIVAPDGVDTEFLKSLRQCVHAYLEKPGRKLVMVVGGGGPARRYQNAYREISADKSDADEADWIGITATRLNAQLLRAVFRDLCCDDVVTDPTAAPPVSGRILVAAGWKPGFSTDFDAVLLAERFGASTVLNLSNIAQVYTADPKQDPDARPLNTVSWREFRRIVGDEWVPGKNVPFDPVASRKAEELKLRVIAADGKNLENVTAILEGRAFFGTTIGPE